jgi:hypothetical protein
MQPQHRRKKTGLVPSDHEADVGIEWIDGTVGDCRTKLGWCYISDHEADEGIEWIDESGSGGESRGPFLGGYRNRAF